VIDGAFILAEIDRMGEPIYRESVAEIAAGVARGTVDPVAVVTEAVDRCRHTHAALNALVQSRADAAIAEASRLAEAPPGPLAGVPVSVKECFAVRGLVTTLGIRGRASALDRDDAGIVTRLRAAGAIVIGKGNVPQALYLHETDNPLWGKTVHPTDAERGPGGSSGGDAALVAAGCVPLAIGNDLAGSIRQPAHACGIVGLLPRAETLGSGGSFETMPRLVGQRSRAGFLARTVDDAEAGFHGLCGVPAVGATPVHRLRVGWWDDAGVLTPSPAVRRAVAEAVERLASAGATVTRLDPEVAAEAAWLHLGILSSDGGADIRRLFAGERPIEQVRRLLALAGIPGWARGIVAGACVWGGRALEARALRRTGPRRGAAREGLFSGRAAIDTLVTRWATAHDCIVCPVSALPALRHGSASRLLLAASPCLLANLLDLAAGAVPVTTVRGDEESGRPRSSDPVDVAAIAADRGSAGLPVAVQVIALDRRPGIAESIVLGVMRGIAGRGGVTSPIAG
jgi:fatty acid amide hydrolase